MLRPLTLVPNPAPLVLRVSSFVAVIATTLLAVGLRPPTGASHQTAASAQTVTGNPITAKEAATLAVRASDLEAKYVPANAIAVAVFRPKEVVSLYVKVKESARTQFAGSEKVDLTAMSSCNVAVAVMIQPVSGQPEPFAIALIFADSQSRDVAAKLLSLPGFYRKEKLLLAEYEVQGNNARYEPDETTFIFGDRQVVERMIAAGPSSLSPLTQTDAWKAAIKQSVAIAFDTTALEELASQMRRSPTSEMLSPLWKVAGQHTIGVTHGESATLTLTSKLLDETGAKLAEVTLNTGIATLKDILAQAKQEIGPPERYDAIAAVEDMLVNRTLNRTGSLVNLRLTSDASSQSSVLVAILAPAISNSRLADQRTQRRNKMRQILHALHNYHDVHGHFPSAVVIDPESGVQRSWRVEILPFLNAFGLYQQYRQDEPWDSEANKKVLAQMPSVFRHPSEPGDAENTSVFAAYGKGLFFEVNDQVGIRFRDITDGTSNTIAIVEAKRNIPWTKPEDILIDLKADKLPEFGYPQEYFFVGLSDGSVRAIVKTIDSTTLRNLFTRAGGEFVDNF